MRPRLPLRHLLPLAVLVTGFFGLYYLYWGAVALGRGRGAMALFYGVYGIGGIALAIALWRAWGQIRRLPPRAPDAPPA